MWVARCAGWGFFTTALLGAGLLAGCGGGTTRRSELMGGTVAVGGALADAAVRLRCADGSVFETTTNASGIWQIVLTTQPLPCALQASRGSVLGGPNSTAYHSVALAYGVTNISTLSNLVTARLLGADPQTWFANPNFAGVNADSVQRATAEVKTALGLDSTLGSLNPLTEPFNTDSFSYVVFHVLNAMDTALADPRVNQSYDQLLAAAISGDWASNFASFGAAFATAYGN